MLGIWIIHSNCRSSVNVLTGHFPLYNIRIFHRKSLHLVPRLTNVLRRLCGPHGFPSRRHFPGIEWRQREAGHLSPSSAVVNAWSFTCIAHVWMAWLFISPCIVYPTLLQPNRRAMCVTVIWQWLRHFVWTGHNAQLCTFSRNSANTPFAALLM